MKRILYILIILVAVVSFGALFADNAEAACRTCVGDAACDISPSILTPVYNCSGMAGVLCSDCYECGCTDPTPPPSPPPGALTPIVQCGGYLDDGVTRQPACTLCDLFEMISRIIRLVVIYGFAIGGMMLVVGGIMMYFGGSNPGMLSNAKSMVKNVIIGIVVMLVSFLIVFTVIHVLSGGTADTMFNLKSGGFYIECNSP
jgi:hypothetical protein